MSIVLNMKKRSGKLRRVSWAPDKILCQVRMFHSDHCPKIGYEAQQMKASSILRSNDLASSDIPPGFGGGGKIPQLKGKLFSIPKIKWKCPPKFIVSYEWEVVAGEESKEAEAQKVRELGVLEAVYPHVTCIPHSPADALNKEEYPFDNHLTPIVPLTPIEDEDPKNVPSDLATPTDPITMEPPSLPHSESASATIQHNTSNMNSFPIEKPARKPSIQADVATTAASVALAAILKSKEQGSMIDTDLLIKILSDQKMVEKLLKEKLPANTASAPKTGQKPEILSRPLPCPGTGLGLSTGSANGSLGTNPNRAQPPVVAVPLKPDSVSVCWTKPAPLCSLAPIKVFATMPPITAVSVSSLTVRPSYNMMQTHQKIGAANSLSAMKVPLPPVKDINYYKNLVKLHGGENQDNQDKIISQYGKHGQVQDTQDTGPMHNSQSRILNPKLGKPCMYFKSSKGCRNGLNCPYKHDLTVQLQVEGISEVPSAKRMKFSREITGRG